MAPPLVIATIAVGLAFALMSVGLWASHWRWVPRLGFLAVAIAASCSVVAEAETPFGVGNGIVPELRGTDLCEARERLSKRELRWRFSGDRHIYSTRPDCANNYGAVGRQSPRPGTRIGAGGVVTLTPSCIEGCI
jgi:beta-lactam-binding protein with PASTA domain